MNIFFLVKNRDLFYPWRSFQRINLYLARTYSLKNSVARLTISRAGINKNKHSFTSAKVFGLPSSTGPFEFSNKVVTLLMNQKLVILSTL